jgi:tetratricopeptide (TPR) repeat protein
LQAISKIKIEHAESTVAEEQQMILAEVNEHFIDEHGGRHFMKIDGGSEGLNALVAAELRDKWVVGSAWALVAMQTGQDGELETEEALEVGRKIASLMGIQFGKWTEAKTLWGLVADGSEKLYGSNARNTLQALGQKAQAMRYLNESSESRKLFEAVVQRQRALLDRNDETLLITQQNFANLLRSSLHDFAAAREIEENVIAGFAALHGPDHERTLTARGNFGLTLEMEGRFHDAKREYEAVLHAQRHRYGSRHPLVLHTQYNLALLLHNRLGDARGGRKLLQEMLKVGETVLGAGHPQTKRATKTLALWGRGW